MFIKKTNGSLYKKKLTMKRINDSVYKSELKSNDTIFSTTTHPDSNTKVFDRGCIDESDYYQITLLIK
jgi:hypothetical protein